MGGFAPGKLKSRRGWRSSPRRLRYRFRLRPGIQELTAGDSINFWPVAILSPLSTCRALAHSGPPKWPSLSPPPTSYYWDGFELLDFFNEFPRFNLQRFQIVEAEFPESLIVLIE